MAELVVTREEILELMKRGHLGRARDVYTIIALADGGRLGRVIRLTIEQLQPLLGCGYQRAKELRQRAVRFNLIQLVGRSECRRVPPAGWRRVPLRGVQITTANGVQNTTELGSETQPNEWPQYTTNGSETQPEAMGCESLPLVGSESQPGVSHKTVEDPPRLGKGNHLSASSKDSFPNIHSESTPNNEHGWAFATAKHVCQRLQLAPSDANGIGAELRRHTEGRDSAVNLVNDIMVNPPDGGWTSGAQIVSEFRQRWGEWTAGPIGPAYERYRREPDITQEEWDAIQRDDPLAPG